VDLAVPDSLGRLSGFRLTIRHGPKVAREKHASLDDAVASMRAHVDRIRAEGGLPEVTMFRTYEPGVRVHARLEISAGGMLRSRDAGVDIMGNGALVPFAGGVFRKPLEVADGGDPMAAVAAALAR
jgi:hypothetical protein